MSLIKALDVAYVRFSVPDLARQRAFLRDFGLIEKAGDADGMVYFRGQGAAPFCYTMQEGEPAFLGLGVYAADRADLDKIAAHDGAAVEATDAPGGGYRVRLTDPNGFVVDVVAGQTPVAPIPVAPALPWNEGGSNPRASVRRRGTTGAAHVQRLGHVVLGVSDFRASEAWYKERFGLITSDEVQPAPGVALGAFMRMDRGDQLADHHAIVCVQLGGPPGFMHAAFEVAGVDDLMFGHEHLKAAGHKLQWGTGRHILGSQVFDYWQDPYGNEMEHWTDGDQFTAADPGGVATMADVLGVQWGAPFPGLSGAPGA